MNFFNWLKPRKSPPKVSKTKTKKILGEVQQFDDVWIKISENVYEGWITEIVQDKIAIVYTDADKHLRDITFKKERPLDRTIVVEENKTLILNENDK